MGNLGLGLGTTTDDVQMIFFALSQVAIFGTAVLAFLQSRQNQRKISENTTITKSVETKVNGTIASLRGDLAKTQALLTKSLNDNGDVPIPKP
jgi:heme/copper-type cytochrome/quinol oxidase subunit 3